MNISTRERERVLWTHFPAAWLNLSEICHSRPCRRLVSRYFLLTNLTRNERFVEKAGWGCICHLSKEKLRLRRGFGRTFDLPLRHHHHQPPPQTILLIFQPPIREMLLKGPNRVQKDPLTLSPSRPYCRFYSLSNYNVINTPIYITQSYIIYLVKGFTFSRHTCNKKKPFADTQGMKTFEFLTVIFGNAALRATEVSA